MDCEAGPSGLQSQSQSQSNKRPLNNSRDRTPLPKRPNVESQHDDETPLTDLIRVEVSKVTTTFLS